MFSRIRLPLLRSVTALLFSGLAAAPASGRIEPLELFRPHPTEPARWDTTFAIRGTSSPDSRPDFVLQQGELRARGYTLQTEMGDILIDQTPGTVQGLVRRGGRVSLLSGSDGNSLKIETFAAPGTRERPSERLLGAAGEISLNEGGARVKTVYLQGAEELTWGRSASTGGYRRAELLGFLAALRPLGETMAAEAEVDFSGYDKNTEDAAAPLQDLSCRIRAGGALQQYRYSVLYERTGPDFRTLNGGGPGRDTEGISFGLGTDLPLHLLELRFARKNDNVDGSPLLPRYYSYEGSAEYTFRGFDRVPLGMQYRKCVRESAREPSGFSPRGTDEETLSGRMNYLSGPWDLGLQGSYSERTDRIREQREARSTVLSLLPRFRSGSLSLSPVFTIKRSMDFSSLSRTGQISIGFDGKFSDRKMDYALKGEVRRERRDLSASASERFGANLKASLIPLKLFRNLQPSLGVKGEYRRMDDFTAAGRNNSNSFSVLLDLACNEVP